MVLVLYKIR